MDDVIWSCPDCGTDLDDWWCPRCEMVWASPAVVAGIDPPDWMDEEGARLAERESYIGTWSHQDVIKRSADDGV